MSWQWPCVVGMIFLVWRETTSRRMSPAALCSGRWRECSIACSMVKQRSTSFVARRGLGSLSWLLGGSNSDSSSNVSVSSSAPQLTTHSIGSWEEMYCCASSPSGPVQHAVASEGTGALGLESRVRASLIQDQGLKCVAVHLCAPELF